MATAAKRLDWYRQSMDGLAAWWSNFAKNIDAVAAKYNITAPQLASIAADNEFIQHWVGVRHSAAAFSQQLTSFFNTITGNDPTKDPPAAIVFEVPDAPAQVPPGIEFRAREIARQIKGHSAYAEADGELLDIIGALVGEGPEPTLDFTVKTLPAFQLETTFKKLGNDAAKFEFRYKGGNWQPAATVINSPGTFAIPPQVAGTAEQIELRGVYLKGNETSGEFTDAKPAFIAP